MSDFAAACREVVLRGRERVEQCLREFGYDSMEYAECRAAWLACIDGLRAHVDADLVRQWQSEAIAPTAPTTEAA